MRTVVGWDVCQHVFHFLKLGRLARCGGLAPLLPRQEFCHRQLDPQPVARLCHHAWTNHMDFANSVNLQLVRMSFVNLQLARMSFVNLQLARTTFVNLLLVRMTLVNLQLVHMTFVNLLLVRKTRPCPDFVNDLRLHEVHTAFLDQRFVSLAVLEEGVSREVCFDSVFAHSGSALSLPPHGSHVVSGGFRF